MNRIQQIFRAFKYRNYRLFFFGQGVSTVGTLMQQIAQGWLVYRLTNSPFMLGIVAFAGQAPAFFFTPVAGLLCDRYDRRWILLIVDVVQMIQAFTMTFLIFTGMIVPWHIVVLSVILGSAAAFEMTTRHSLVPQMVLDRQDLGNAIALNSVMFNMARLTGPALAGIIIAWAGEGICFLINGLSFIAIIVALLLMDMKKHIYVKQKKPLHELREGLKYVYQFMPLRTIILSMAFVSFTGSGVMVLLPVFARDILHGGPKTFGFLTGAVGFGAMLGALFIASRHTVRKLGILIPTALFLFGTALVATALTESFLIVIPFLMVAGLGTMMYMSSSNTIIQTVVDDDKRGRVMSLYILAFSGFLPLGNLVAGYAAKLTNVKLVMICSGMLTLVSGTVWVFLLPKVQQHLRPLYIKKGIIPVDTSVDTGVEIN